jgi:hypothetical protein
MVVPAVVVEPFLSGSLEALPAGLADRFSSSLVLVVGRDVADRLMQAHRVVLDPHAGELGFEHDRVVDVLEMGPFALDVTEQRLDPRLIRRRVRPAPVLGDRQQPMNALVSAAAIGGPLSETASRIGRAGSSTARSRRSSVNSSSRPSSSRACSKRTWTWVAVSSTDTSVSIHLRDTMSTMANTTRRALVKWVAS